MPDERGLVVCAFHIPKSPRSDKTALHPASLSKMFQDEIYRVFRALTGPTRIYVYRYPETIPGGWVPPTADEKDEDENRRYKISIPEERIDELRLFLRKAGNTFDQVCIYLEVAGHAELLEVREEDGFLFDEIKSVT